MQPLSRQKANSQILILISQPGQHFPTAPEGHPSRGGSQVFRDPRALTAERQKQGPLSFHACFNSCWLSCLTTPESSKCSKPLRKGEGGLWQQLRPITPALSRTSPDMRNRREQGMKNTEEPSSEKQEAFSFTSYRPVGLQGWPRTRGLTKPLLLSPAVTHVTGQQS